MKTLNAKILGGFAEKTTFDALPQDVVHWTKRHILDQLGVILGGSIRENSKVVYDLVMDLGGRKESTIIGYNCKTSCSNAALANGTFGHTLELDDTHIAAVTIHPSVGVVPAALAMAEREGAGGKAFMVSYVVGHELAVRIAGAFDPEVSRGFHATPVCDLFGAVASAGKILGLSVDEYVNAFGIAGSMAAGLAPSGSRGWIKRLHPGHAAHDGVISALLAQKGYLGSATVFESKRAFYKAYSGPNHDLKFLIDGLGERFDMLKTSYKWYACCRWLNGVCNAASNLIRKYGSINPKDVDSVLVKSYGSVLGYFDTGEYIDKRYHLKNSIDAQFSGPFVVAATILGRPEILTGITEEMVKDPEIRELASKVKAELDPELEKRYGKFVDPPVSLTVRLKDGREYRHFQENVKGDPKNPLTDADLEEKFRKLASLVPLSGERKDRIIRTVWNLEKVHDMSQLTELLKT